MQPDQNLPTPNPDAKRSSMLEFLDHPLVQKVIWAVVMALLSGFAVIIERRTANIVERTDKIEQKADTAADKAIVAAERAEVTADAQVATLKAIAKDTGDPAAKAAVVEVQAATQASK